MSLSYTPLNPILVRDPITEIQTRDFIVLKGGSQVTWKKYTTTSISNSAITWSCPPPSGNIFVDKKQYVLLPIRLTFTATGAGVGNILNYGYDAPRAFPINGSLEVLQSSINGQSFSIFISDIVHALTHFNTDMRLHTKDYSTTPNYPDQSQSYSDLIGSIRNPLGGYINGLSQVSSTRGSFPFTIVQNTPTVAIVDMVVVEPLFLSPYYFGSGNSTGWYNVTTMDFNLTFLSNANRFWSHITAPGSNPVTNIQASFNNFSPAFSYTENQPIMLFKYITPDSLESLSPNMPITYPYYDVQRYPLDFTGSVLPGTTVNQNSNNLQLNSIPRMMYIYARTKNQDLYANGTGCTLTDTYLALESINITFSNYTGLLSSCSKFQLYQIACKNGLSSMSWSQWSGEKQNNANFNTPVTQYGTIGSILAIEFSTDLGLPESMCPGLQGQYTMQVNTQFKNTSSSPINATLFVVIVNEGSFTIPGLNSATRQLGIVTKEDVLNAQMKPSINYDDVRDSLYGGEGNFFSNLRDFGSKINDFLKSSKVISTVASALPFPIAQTIGTVAKNIGYGEGNCDGGIVYEPRYHDYGSGVSLGGKHLSKKELRNRLKNM